MTQETSLITKIEGRLQDQLLLTLFFDFLLIARKTVHDPFARVSHKANTS